MRHAKWKREEAVRYSPRSQKELGAIQRMAPKNEGFGSVGLQITRDVGRVVKTSSELLRVFLIFRLRRSTFSLNIELLSGL